jgi:hypothetical protein
MRRSLMVALSVGLAAGASLAFAGISGAQAEDPGEPIPGTMEVQPAIVVPGGAVTAEAISPCHPDGAVDWEVIQLVGGGDVPPLAGSAQAGADGYWTVDFTAPDDVGRYRFTATCTMGDSTPYTYSAEFRAQYETPSEPPDTDPDPNPAPGPDPQPGSPEPASPIPGEPNFAG